MDLAIIVAISPENAIGVKGKLPWNLPEDLEHFKQLTSGQTVVMGKNTWKSLPAKVRPLPGRTNIIITDEPLGAKGATECLTLDEAIAAAKRAGKEIFIIGGAYLYSTTISLASVLHISHVKKSVKGDVFFPEIKESEWRCVEEVDYKDFTYKKYVRR
jgi:dihydrofolate reductase